MIPGLHILTGEDFTDDRGRLRFYNALDLSKIKRMYEITPSSPEVIRAWQGHRVEEKWFHCISGSFIINLIKIDDFEQPSPELVTVHLKLNSNTPQVLRVEGGFASGIKALEAESRLLVFSDMDLEESKNDDYRFATDYWRAQWYI